MPMSVSNPGAAMIPLMAGNPMALKGWMDIPTPILGDMPGE